MSRSRRLLWLLLPIGLTTAAGFTLGKTRTMVGVTVTPNPSTSPRRPPNTNGFTASFTVKNTSASQDTYAMSCGTSSNITCTNVSPSSVTLNSQQSTTVTATYNTGAGGSGWLQLCAEGGHGVGCGQQTIPVNTAQVTPDGATSAKRAANSGGYKEIFTVKNAGTTSMTYTMTCTGSSNVTCSGMSPASLTLGAGAQTSDTANYSVGAQGTGTLKAIATSGADADTGSYSIPVFLYSVAVTPDSGETVARWENSSLFWETFTVKNTGSDTDSYTFTCSGLGNITCPTGTWGVSPYQATLAPGATVSVSAPYATAEAGTGRLTLSAASDFHGSSDQGWFWVPVVTSGTIGGVTPLNAWTKGAFAGASYSQTFVVTNPDTAWHKYGLSCRASTNVVCPTGVLPDTIGPIAPQSSYNQAVGYSINAGATGTGWIQFCLNSVDLCNNKPHGTLNFTIWPNVAHGVSVTSATTPAPVSFTNGYTQVFTVRNVGTSSDTYNFTCLSSTNVTCGTVTPSSQTLASLDTTVVTVAYSTGASGAGYVSLQASNANASNTKQVNFTVTPGPGYRIAVTPDAKSIGVLASTAASYPFAITNPGTLQNTYTIASSCIGAAIASGCTVSPTSVTLAAGASSIATVSYTSGGVSTTGVIKVTASQSNDAGVKDTGWINLATGTAQAPTVNVSGVNPGTTVERDLCLTVGLHDAAAECGDLRLAHGVPAVRTMGRARAPTLLYSSAQAHPKAIVAAEVTLPAGAANPDSVEVVLRIAGDSIKARWGGSSFSPSRANRVSLGYEALSLASGVYSYTLDVRDIYPSSVLGASPAGAGELIVVNHSQDEFGAGWWLAGLERIRIDSMLWIGGDGSARLYRSAGTNIWAAAAVDRPDTVKKVGTEYVRLLPAKAEVWFDAQGRHVRTVSRLKHDTTYFHRNATTGKLDSITVAPANQAIRYKFVYNGTSGLLDSVIAPGARVVKLTRSGSQVTSIRDPDLTSVSFGYDGSYTNRIVTRTDRMNDVATYVFDAAGKIARDSLDPGSSQPVIVTRLRAIESVGFAGSVAPDTADAYALIDGARTDVGDSTQVWMHRFGARRIRNALGAETSALRENATYPGLVTRIQTPSGQVIRAVYDIAGHVVTTTDSGTVVNGQVAVTRFAWNMAWDADTLVVPPEGDSTVIGIEATTGHRLWQQDAGGSADRVNFTYFGATGLLATIQEPGTAAVTSLSYDGRGNLTEAVSPLGFRDSTLTDSVGRDTLHISPIDAAQTKKQSTRTVYNSAGRIAQMITRAPAMPYTLANGATPDTTGVVAETTTVTNTYDNEGRLTLTLARTSPLFDGYLIPGVSDSRTYDRAGRLLSRSVGSAPTGFTYDAAGNAVTLTYRNGGVVSAQFDALNRLTRRIVSRRTYGRTDCLGHAFGPLYTSLSICSMKFPMYSNTLGDSLEIPADTSLFAFDSAGNMIQADNRDAHVRRHYAVNGALTADSLWMRDYASSAFTKVYGLRYGYDRDGRRVWMKLPATLAGGQDSMAYAYSPKNGALIRVRDGANRRDSLTYTPAGRLDSLLVFAAGASTPGIKESHQYDVDGRLTARERRTGANAVLQSDQLTYDARGNVTYASTSSAAIAQGTQTFNLAYDGLGAVVASQVSNSMGVWDLEEFRTDGLGNVEYQHVRHAADQSIPPQTSTYGPNHLLKGRVGWLPDQCPTSPAYLDTLYQTADAAGNVIRAGDEHRDCSGNPTSQTATNSYYSADNRLVVSQRFVWAPGQQVGGTLTGSWEEYRYDALGRRIMTRARRDHPTLCNQSASTTCIGFVERVAWDGDQILYEQRTSGLDVITGGPPNYGTIGYVHALGVDRPVMLTDGRVLHYNWRGLAEASSWADGTPADDQLVGGGSTHIAWPAGQGVYYRRATDPYAGLQVTWIGSLPSNGATSTGELYRRHRFFDPASGRFTQEDPVGLAGGLNLYGFANGDPVNFSDAFGLCASGDGDGSQGGSDDAPPDSAGQDPGGKKKDCPEGDTAWPVGAPNSIEPVSSPFGADTPGRRAIPGASVPHQGIDQDVPAGTGVGSMAAGIVVAASYSDANGYFVTVRHDANFTSTYIHLASYHPLKKGDPVDAGTTIGFVGPGEGITNGKPNLHFQLNKDGKAVDPSKCLPKQ